MNAFCGVAEVLEGGYAGELDHGFGPADEHEGVSRRRRQVFFDHGVADEPLAELPA